MGRNKKENAMSAAERMRKYRRKMSAEKKEQVKASDNARKRDMMTKLKTKPVNPTP